MRYLYCLAVVLLLSAGCSTNSPDNPTASISPSPSDTPTPAPNPPPPKKVDVSHVTTYALLRSIIGLGAKDNELYLGGNHTGSAGLEDFVLPGVKKLVVHFDGDELSNRYTMWLSHPEATIEAALKRADLSADDFEIVQQSGNAVYLKNKDYTAYVHADKSDNWNMVEFAKTGATEHRMPAK